MFTDIIELPNLILNFVVYLTLLQWFQAYYLLSKKTYFPCTEHIIHTKLKLVLLGSLFTWFLLVSFRELATVVGINRLA